MNPIHYIQQAHHYLTQNFSKVVNRFNFAFEAINLTFSHLEWKTYRYIRGEVLSDEIVNEKIAGLTFSLHVNHFALSSPSPQLSGEQVLSFLVAVPCHPKFMEFIHSIPNRTLRFSDSLESEILDEDLHEFALIVKNAGGILHLRDKAEAGKLSLKETFQLGVVFNAFEKTLSTTEPEGLGCHARALFDLFQYIEKNNYSLITQKISEISLENVEGFLNNYKKDQPFLSHFESHNDQLTYKYSFVPLAGWYKKYKRYINVDALLNSPIEQYRILGRILQSHGDKLNEINSQHYLPESKFSLKKLYSKAKHILELAKSDKIDDLLQEEKLTVAEYAYLDTLSTYSYSDEENAFFREFKAYFKKHENGPFLHVCIEDSKWDYLKELRTNQLSFGDQSQLAIFKLLRYGATYFKVKQDDNPEHLATTYKYFSDGNRDVHLPPRIETREYAIDPLKLVPGLPEDLQDEFKKLYAEILVENLNSTPTEYPGINIKEYEQDKKVHILEIFKKHFPREAEDFEKTENFQSLSPSLLEKRIKAIKGEMAAIYNEELSDDLSTSCKFVKMTANAIYRIVLARLFSHKQLKIKELDNIRYNCSHFTLCHIVKAAVQACEQLKANYPDKDIPIPETMGITGLQNFDYRGITPYLLRKSLLKQGILCDPNPSQIIPLKKFVRSL